MQNDSQKGSLGSRFEHFNAAPSAGLWDSIASNLDEKKKRRGVIWWWIGPGIAAVVLISFIGITQLGDSNHALVPISKLKANQFSNTDHAEAQRIEIATVTPAENNATLNAELKTAAELAKQNEKSDPLKRDEDLVKTNEEGGKEGDALRTDSTNQLTTAEIAENSIINKTVESFEQAEKQTIKLPELMALTTESSSLVNPKLETKKKRSWEIGVGATSWASLNLTKSSSDINVDTISPTDLTTSEGLQVKYTKINASRPLGLTTHVGYNLNARFRLVSGINVESTVYHFTVVDNSFQELIGPDDFSLYKNKMRVLSIGVPIGVEYDFLELKRFRLGAGLMVLNEFPILESYSLENSSQNEKNRTIISGYHFGTNLNLNLSYRLNERFKIQVNPGVRWYPYQQTKSTLTISQRSVWYGGTVRFVWDI